MAKKLTKTEAVETRNRSYVKQENLRCCMNCKHRRVNQFTLALHCGGEQFEIRAAANTKIVEWYGLCDLWVLRT